MLSHLTVFFYKPAFYNVTDVIHFSLLLEGNGVTLPLN